ncbi:MAG: hypothetical protein WAX57_03940, partial [Minisyncoccia bacterium]
SSMLKGVSALKNDESYIIGYETKKRLAGQSLLGVEAFWQCWNDRDSIPAELRDKTIFFDGDVLQSPDGNRCSLYLSWDGDEWRWHYRWLDSNRYSDFVSACAS